MNKYQYKSNIRQSGNFAVFCTSMQKLTEIISIDRKGIGILNLAISETNSFILRTKNKFLISCSEILETNYLWNFKLTNISFIYKLLALIEISENKCRVFVSVATGLVTCGVSEKKTF